MSHSKLIEIIIGIDFFFIPSSCLISMPKRNVFENCHIVPPKQLYAKVQSSSRSSNPGALNNFEVKAVLCHFKGKIHHCMKHIHWGVPQYTFFLIELRSLNQPCDWVRGGHTIFFSVIDSKMIFKIGPFPHWKPH